MRAAAGLLVIAMAVAGCATQPMPPPGSQADLSHTVEQPLRDLSLVREQAPEVLQRAAVDPYDMTGVEDCAAAIAELARLDAALEPDLAPGSGSTGVSVQGLATDLIAGAFGLPFRGVVRTISGAESRDRALRAAVLAGMVRRGFLKGRLDLMRCPPSVRPASGPA